MELRVRGFTHRKGFASMYTENDTPTDVFDGVQNGKDIRIIVYDGDPGQVMVMIDDWPEFMPFSKVDEYLRVTTVKDKPYD
jgi:hypothetical protein